jgi:hypothetical protein
MFFPSLTANQQKKLGDALAAYHAACSHFQEVLTESTAIKTRLNRCDDYLDKCAAAVADIFTEIAPGIMNEIAPGIMNGFQDDDQ